MDKFELKYLKNVMFWFLLIKGKEFDDDIFCLLNLNVWKIFERLVFNDKDDCV